MEDYKHKLGNLADKLRKETPRTPIQEVQPVRRSLIIKVAEVQFNNWIPKTLLKRLKAFGVEHDQSLKDINTEALEMFLNTKAKQIKTTENAD
jgi:hypothetical protein